MSVAMSIEPMTPKMTDMHVDSHVITLIKLQSNDDRDCNHSQTLQLGNYDTILTETTIKAYWNI